MKRSKYTEEINIGILKVYVKNGPQNVDSALSEIFPRFQATNS
jgi:hypothetical protein